jgi:DNA topoisomerase VI subunit B
MPKFLSKSLTAEFIYLDGLQRLTNVTAHDWDLYIFKELVDNALDADEADPKVITPHVSVVVSYTEGSREGNHDRALSIKVTNQSQFPLDRIEDVFDFNRRASVKNYYSNPTRGAQGNALKTILGMPYALRNYYFTDYTPDRIPLSISYGNHRVVIKLNIDELVEQVELETPSETLDAEDEPQPITIVHVNIGRFLQQRPRTLDQLMSMAKAFVLFNPHANFDFEFVLTKATGKYTSETYQSIGNPDWYGRYDHNRPAPIHWYRLNKFRTLVFAV